MTPDDSVAPHRSHERLAVKLQETQLLLDQLIRGGRWLVWASLVTRDESDAKKWRWSFRRDISPIMPDWFNVDHSDGECLSTMLQRVRLPDDSTHCDRTFDRALRSGAPGYTQMFRVRLRDGSMSWVEEHVAIEPLSDDSWRLVGICIDATERKLSEERLKFLQAELEAKQAELMEQNSELQALREKLEGDKVELAEVNAALEDLATTDGLTGIKNHRAFQEQLGKEWIAAKRMGEPLSLIMLDIDHFKLFNDTFGHPAGDEVLKCVGRILKIVSRASDCPARYGGEEFAIVLPRTDVDGAIALAERFRSSIEDGAWSARSITASLGVSTLRAQSGEHSALVIAADKALYRAKTDGRNCVRHVDRFDAAG